MSPLAHDPEAARRRAMELELNRDLKREREREHKREQEVARVRVWRAAGGS